MARMARVVVPGIPHHVVQRGVRRMKTFFSDADKKQYLWILQNQSRRFGLQIWAYCLMDNHVHLIAVPKTQESLAKAIGETHKRYTLNINARENWKGYLWQGRFQSYVMDESYLYAAIRYVEQNPVKAGIVQKAEQYPWSSASSHVYKVHNPLLSDFFLTSQIKDWSEFLEISRGPNEDFERHLRTGRPLGDEKFLYHLENSLGRKFQKLKPGPRGHIT